MKVHIARWGRRATLPLVYSYGLASLFCADVVVSLLFDADDVASWARQKSAFMICMAVGLGGLDTLLFRRPYLKARLSVALLAASVVAALIVPLYFLRPSERVAHALFLMVVPASTLASFWATDARTKGRLLVAQAWWCSWRGAILPGVAIMALMGASLLLPAILLPLIPIVLWCSGTVSLAKAGLSDLATRGPRKALSLFRAAAPLTVALVSLAVAYNFEIILISRLAQPEDIQRVFILVAFLLAPTQAFTSFAGFLALPTLRRGRSIFTSAPERGLLVATSSAVLISVAAVCGGVLAVHLSGKRDLVDIPALVWALTISISRMMYVWPSGYFGVFASERQLWRSVLLGVGCQLAGVAAFGCLVVAGASPTSAALFASALSWVARTFAAYVQMMPMLRADVVRS